MTEHLRDRLTRLLGQLPDWKWGDRRNRFLDEIMYGHPLWDSLPLPEGADAASERLVILLDQYGYSAILVLLAGIREHHKSFPSICQESDALAIRFRAHRPRQLWIEAPYRGLAYFDHKHAPIFFGREAEVDALYNTITQTEQGRRFCVVVGASGSGKSSLVRAGLWPRLTETKQWFICAMRGLKHGPPTSSLRHAFLSACEVHDGFEDKCDLAEKICDDSEPLAPVAAGLLSKSPGTRWLLILDQMEELFAPGSKDEGGRFLRRLLEATRPASDGTPSRFQVLATLRADFYHYCLDHPPLQCAIYRPGGQFPLTAPGRLALERMVSGPLTELELSDRWTLDPALPQTIALDAERHPGGLALMAFTIRELYDVSSATRRLDVETYRSEAFGGLSGAIARRADATLKALGEDSAKTLERVFARLVRVNRDDAPTRRREPLSAWDDDPECRKLVDAFVKARLLVCDTGAVVEVAHEALLREWPTLASWIEQRRDAFALAERVRTEAQAWMNGPASRHHRRPWDTELIDDYRGQLAGAGLLKQLCEDPHVARLLSTESEWLLDELKLEETTHLRRAQIGNRLAELGDTRPGVGVVNGVPDILWRPIPAGEVEIEEHGVFPVAPFHIAAFLVTSAQFRAFLDAADGYRNEEWWKGLKQGLEGPWTTLPANHPITSVSWYDAVAFCRWLTVRRRYEIRLPHESEWQWAAQSAQPHYRYPWGQKANSNLANTSESGIRGTTAVGMYPGGDSFKVESENVSDLAGNVWEWCRNVADPHEPAAYGRAWHVVRGGSWYGRADFARAAFRDLGDPVARGRSFGFRVVSSSPIADL